MSGAVCQMHTTFLNDLGCHRLLPAEVTSPLPSCRYPCIIKYTEAPLRNYNATGARWNAVHAWKSSRQERPSPPSFAEESP
ncbi:hypothetical protein MTO96_030356 [Rhipicephalus appendiculatus]